MVRNGKAEEVIHWVQGLRTEWTGRLVVMTITFAEKAFPSKASRCVYEVVLSYEGTN